MEKLRKPLTDHERKVEKIATHHPSLIKDLLRHYKRNKGEFRNLYKKEQKKADSTIFLTKAEMKYNYRLGASPRKPIKE